MKVVVATDRSETARQAVAWAADLARGFAGELVLLQVLTDPVEGAEEQLQADAAELDHARALLRVEPDIAAAIVRAAEEENADVLVVGNAGMGGRKEFLLGNIPNRVSHAARCTVVIVNTTDGAVPEPEPEEVAEAGLLRRAARIARVFARFGLDARATASPADRAKRLRSALEELGPTFAKLGQMLSTRPDLVPPDVVDELAKLQDDVAPLAEAEIVHVMEQELRVPWEDVFESIEPAPLAAGTIGQVHRATLENGEHVIVKVQRPNAREEITRDLGLLELFAEKALEHEALRRTVDIPALVGHLSESLQRELDFLQEAANLGSGRCSTDRATGQVQLAIAAPAGRPAAALLRGTEAEAPAHEARRGDRERHRCPSGAEVPGRLPRLGPDRARDQPRRTATRTRRRVGREPRRQRDDRGGIDCGMGPDRVRGNGRIARRLARFRPGAALALVALSAAKTPVE